MPAVRVGPSGWRVWSLVAAVVLACAMAGGALGAAGALDTSFGSGGMVLTNFGFASYDRANAVAVQSDGKIVTAGCSNAKGSNDFAVVRYTRRGRLDWTFGSGGKVLTDLGSASCAAAVAVQTDGKIVAAGSSNVVRYTKFGKLDRSFGSGGKVLTDLGAAALAVQTDGKIVVAGSSSANGSEDFALVRYTTSGKLDRSFGSGGKVLTDLGSASEDQAYAVALQADGKIVTAGYRNATGNDDFQDFAVVRYTKSGKLDSSFGSRGKVLTHLGSASFDLAFAVALQTDGRIVAVGQSNANGSDDFALVRYTKSGKLDSSFGSGGKVLTDLGSGPVGHGGFDIATAMALQTAGKIAVAGYSYSYANESYDFALVRYTKSGKLDSSFGSGGKVLTDLDGCCSNDLAYAVAVQKDGKIVAAGWSDANGIDERDRDFAVVRYRG